VIQCQAITDIDVSAAQMLEQLDRELNARGIHLAFVELRSRLQTLLRNYELFDQIDQQHIYPSLEAALAAIQNDGTAE
jgi:MFS superfamily sulfate permease-like transporter